MPSAQSPLAARLRLPTMKIPWHIFNGGNVLRIKTRVDAYLSLSLSLYIYIYICTYVYIYIYI